MSKGINAMDKKNQIFIVSGDDWTQLEAGVQDAVVQVCADSVAFNWQQPYIAGTPSESRGSGFFIDGQGYLITAAHVVIAARVIWIKMHGIGKPLFAEVVGICPDRDVALLKLREDSLAFLKNIKRGVPYLILGNSDAIAHTDKILVLGYPLGQNNIKSSTGVISGRESGGGRTFFQITAPVNPGSSGGPIFDIKGAVIGMTIAMISSAQNIGYAVPINDIAVVLADLYKYKIVRTGLLGARFNTCDDIQAIYLKNPLPAGLYINTVIKDTPFDKAGVRAGDMLYAFNGFRIDGSGHTQVPWTADRVSIHDLVSRLSDGQIVPMIIFRAGKEIDINFTFKLMAPFAIRWMYPPIESIEYEIIGGMVLMQLTENHINECVQELPQLSQYLKIENKREPVVIVSHLMPGSIIYLNGSIRIGHIIKEINGKKINVLSDIPVLLKESITTGFFTLKTNDDVFVVFAIKQLLEDEQRLAKDFNYRLTPTIKELIKLMQQSKK